MTLYSQTTKRPADFYRLRQALEAQGHVVRAHDTICRQVSQLPVLKTEAFLHGSADVLVWLGHASFFIRLGGITFLLDPVLGNLPAFGKRLSELPLDPVALTGIDYILLSHAHYGPL